VVAVATRVRDAELLASLQEVIEALDSRMPQAARTGEAQIAADALRIRACAIRRIAMIQNGGASV